MIYSGRLEAKEEPKKLVIMPQQPSRPSPEPVPEPLKTPSVTVKRTSTTEFGSVNTKVSFDAICDYTGEVIRSKSCLINSWESPTSASARGKFSDFLLALREEGFQVKVED